MFVPFVVVFPTRHEGGSVMLHHDGEEWTFDSATILLQQDLPSVAYLAFYSVDHEVTTVNSGYRVTLTYNLYVQPTSHPASLLSILHSVPLCQMHCKIPRFSVKVDGLALG